MPRQQTRQHRQEPFPQGRRLQGGEQHHQALRRRARSHTSETTRPKSVSANAGVRVAVGVHQGRWQTPPVPGGDAGADLGCPPPTGRHGLPHGSPGWPAGATRRSPRPAAARPPPGRSLVRPVSNTHSTRRSRSGRQSRTITCSARAVARQSIDRTSSPTTYSRSESNSVPWPRPRTTTWPSITRSRDSFSGRNRREWNGASTRSVQGGVSRRERRRLVCRKASPNGPYERTVTRTAGRSPRRVGVSSVTTSTASPGSIVTGVGGVRVLRAPAEGTQASRITPRTGRTPRLPTRSRTVAVPPARTRRSPARSAHKSATEPARARSSPTATASSPTTPANQGHGHGVTRPGGGQQHQQHRDTRGQHGTPTGGRGRRPGSPPAPSRGWRPPVPPRAAAAAGAAAWGGPSPSRRRE